MDKILFGLVITLLCVNQLSAQNQDKVVIYQHAYYEGTKQELAIGKYNIEKLTIGNDQLSSIRLPEIMKITLYEDAGFKGNSNTLTEDSEYVDDFNDLTSSIIVEAVEVEPNDNPTEEIPVELSEAELAKLGKVGIYQHGNYTGLEKLLGIGKYNTADLEIGDDQLSSIRVPNNLRATLFTDANFKGESMILTENSVYVGGMNDRTSSIIVEYAPSSAEEKLHFTGCPTGEENLPAQNEAFEKRVWEIVNIERAKLGKPAMAWNPKLALAARYHAIDMATDGYFDHDSHDIIDGKKVKVCGTFDRINKFAPGFGENIAWGNPTPEEAMRSWMNSPGHYANIMSDNPSIGVGFCNNYWVQVFGPKE